MLFALIIKTFRYYTAALADRMPAPNATVVFACQMQGRRLAKRLELK